MVTNQRNTVKTRLKADYRCDAMHIKMTAALLTELERHSAQVHTEAQKAPGRQSNLEQLEQSRSRGDA